MQPSSCHRQLQLLQLQPLSTAAKPGRAPPSRGRGQGVCRAGGLPGKAPHQPGDCSSSTKFSANSIFPSPTHADGLLGWLPREKRRTLSGSKGGGKICSPQHLTGSIGERSVLAMREQAPCQENHPTTTETTAERRGLHSALMIFTAWVCAYLSVPSASSKVMI